MEPTAKTEYFQLQHLVLMTGLTDRTLRSYLASGILQGEKRSGAWQFTAEQVDQFLHHPTVRPSILAKQYSAVYDFLADGNHRGCAACLILDLTEKNRAEAAEHFCQSICNGAYQNIRFSFDGASRVPRVILSGAADEVLQLANSYPLT